MARTEAFDNFSRQYDEWFEKNRELYQLELKAVRALLPESGAGLEIGTGSGKFARPSGINFGIEPSETMALLAQKAGVYTARGVAEYLPVKNFACDFALMVTTVCFVDDVLTSFREALRIIKKHGCLIVGLVDKESRLGQCYQERKDRSRFYREATFYSAKEILALLENAGFRHYETRQTLIEDHDVLTDQVIPGTGRGAFVVIKAMTQLPDDMGS